MKTKLILFILITGLTASSVCFGEDLILTGLLDSQAAYTSYDNIETQGTTTVGANGDVTLGVLAKVQLNPGFSINSGGLLSVVDVDSDNDGIFNEIEETSCTDANIADTDGDGINDGLEDKDRDGIFEIELGETDPCNPDSDGDGIPDGFEADTGLDPLFNDGALDLDNDGIANWVEYYLGTDPADSNSVPNKGTSYVYDELGRIKKIIRIK